SAGCWTGSTAATSASRPRSPASPSRSAATATSRKRTCRRPRPAKPNCCANGTIRSGSCRRLEPEEACSDDHGTGRTAASRPTAPPPQAPPPPAAAPSARGGRFELVVGARAILLSVVSPFVARRAHRPPEGLLAARMRPPLPVSSSDTALAAVQHQQYRARRHAPARHRPAQPRYRAGARALAGDVLPRCPAGRLTRAAAAVLRVLARPGRGGVRDQQRRAEPRAGRGRVGADAADPARGRARRDLEGTRPGAPQRAHARLLLLGARRLLAVRQRARGSGAGQALPGPRSGALARLRPRRVTPCARTPSCARPGSAPPAGAPRRRARTAASHPPP